MAQVIDARIKIKRSTTTGQVPTIAPSNDHLDGTWDALDIYLSELFINTVDTKIWSRTDDGIVQIPFIKDNQNNSYNSASATGTDTYAITLNPTPTAYAAGQTFVVNFTNANTGAATLNVNSLGAKAIQKNGTALASGNIGAGKSYVCYYDGTAFQILGLTSSGGGITNSAGNKYIPKSDGTNLIQSVIYEDTFVAINATTQTGNSEKLRVKTGTSEYGLVHDDGTTQVGTYIDGSYGYIGTLSNHDLKITANNGTGLVTIFADGSGLELLSQSLFLNNSNIVFEGSTADAYETTLTVTDPTADRTITLPNATGTVALTSDLSSYQPLDADLTSWAAITRAANFDTFVATPSSANLKALLSDESGSSELEFGKRPVETFQMQVGAQHAPSDGSTYYYSNHPTDNAITTAGVRGVKITKAVTSADISIYIFVAGTLGTSETATFYLRNITTATDYTITTAATFTAVYQQFSIAGLSIAGSANDLWEIKFVCPSWATNPTTVTYSAYIKMYE